MDRNTLLRASRWRHVGSPLLCMLLTSALHAQGSALPTSGTDFWFGFMQNAYGAQELRVYVTSDVTTSGTVAVPLAGYAQPFTVVANTVTTLLVPNTNEQTGSEVVTGKGVHLTSADPVMVTADSYQSFTHDASRIYPVTALGSEYRIAAYRGLPGFNEFYKSELMIVATVAGTEVEITPSVNTLGGHAAGVPFTVTLDEGETYQVQSALSSLDLTGSLVKATSTSGPCRPFAVFGGSMCANVPVGCPACDHLFEQMIALPHWGTSYHTFKVGAASTTTYRIQAAQNATSVSIDGGAAFALNAGQVHEVNASAAPACISSSAPISVAQVFEGYNCSGSGDPSMVMLEPDAITTQHVRFNTVPSNQINQHRVAVVGPSGLIGQLTLDGTVVATAQFTNYAACPSMVFAVLGIGNGTHLLSAPIGFHAYVHGMGTGESYAYSANFTPSPTVVNDSLLCVTGPVTLTAPGPWTNSTWEAASVPGTVIATGNSFTVTPATNESYTVSGELNGSGCPVSFTYHVGLPVPLALTATANDLPSTTVCQFAPVQLGANPSPDPAWYDVQWSPAQLVSDPNIPDPIAEPMSDTWFVLSVNSPLGCGSATDSVLVQVTPNDLIGAHASTADSAICLGESTQLHGIGEKVAAFDDFNGTSLAPFWAATLGAGIASTCGSVTGSALLFSGNGSRLARTSPMDASLGGTVHFRLMISDGSNGCDDADPGDDVILDYSVNGSSWTTIAQFNEAAFPNFTSLEVPIPVGAQTASTRFRWRQLTANPANQDIWALDNVIIGINATIGTTFQWSPPSGLSNPTLADPMATPTATSWYTVNVDNGNGCTARDSLAIIVAPAFSVITSPDTTICNPASVQLLATPSTVVGTTYSWTPGNGGLSDPLIADPTANPTSTTTYSITATSNIGCTASGSTTVTVGQVMGVTASATDLDLCNGETTVLNAAVQANGNVQLLWSPAATVVAPNLTSTSATPNTSTTYTATLTDLITGCSVADSVAIQVAPAYLLQVTPDTTLCNTLGFQLGVQHNVPAPFTIAWTPAGFLNSASIATPTVMFDTTATYHVTVADANGCGTTDSVSVVDAFDSLISPVNVDACIGQSVTLDAQFPGCTYAWNHGPTTQTVIVTGTDVYVVEITDPQGCQTVKTFYVTFHAAPGADLGPDTLVCGATSLLLDANSPGSNVVWSTGAIGQQLNVTANGIYGVAITSAQGCTATDSIEVQFAPLPSDPLQDIIACGTAPPTLDAGNIGCTYVWSTSETTQTITCTASGTYSVLVTSPVGCSATFDAMVDLVPLPAVELGPDTTLCAGQPIVLDAGNASFTILWNNGATTPTIQPTSSGTYSVSVTNGPCVAVDDVSVTFDPLPVDVLQDVTVCEGQSVTLDAGNPGCTFLWNTSAITQNIQATLDGTYSVTVTTPEACSATFNAVVQFVDHPVVELGPDTLLCEGDVLTLDAGNPGASYDWNTGSHSRTIDVVISGQYSVTVDNGYCQSTDELHATFNPAPTRLTSHELFTCLDEEPHYVVIDAGNPGSDFDWSTGEHSQVILAGAYGWYFVDVTNQFDCRTRDSLQVNEFCPATIYVPNTFTPNSDGINDTWGPVGKNIATLELIVFDRWGGVLFQTNDPLDMWNGTAHGDPVKNDVYVWKMRYRFQEDVDGQIGPWHEQMGHVQVMR
ncbi:MAG: T9SS type B sorting domain-containing protein [Flavobacteriales bacterium]|nr:T9SS type B sorting domain-containing protein [Flavobacteriales bacterium]